MQIMLQDTKEYISLSTSVFSCKFNESLVHQLIVSFLSKERKGNKLQKNRSNVSGSNRKPWKQKGTGRARSGSKKSPIWRKGGVTFSHKNRNFFKKINKKSYRIAVKSIFSELIRKKRLIIFKDFSIPYPKTKLILQKTKEFFSKNLLIITKEFNKNLYLSSRNLNIVKVSQVSKIHPNHLIFFQKTILTYDAVKKIEENLL